MNHEKAFLIILDGWGLGEIPEVSAISMASTPFVDSLYENHPNAQLNTFGSDVGLPTGQMGNSEVGHLNLGAGRIVFQDLARINNEIEDGDFFENKMLLHALNYAKENDKPIHLLGLLSDGGVHSHINHLKALTEMINKNEVEGYIHAFMDGRDTSPDGGINYLREVLEFTENTTVRISSVIGRYYAMDRDQRWERIRECYDLLIHGKGMPSEDLLETIDLQYKNGITDEFINPIKLLSAGEGLIRPDDVVLFYNFRSDRPRQLTEALTIREFPEQEMKPLNLELYTMTQYKEDYENIHVIYEKKEIKNTLGEVIADHGLSQLRIAETEKYPHVTFFFSGGKEKILNHEERILIDSPKVATYDLQPEMSAEEVKTAVMKSIKENAPDFICLNFANTDMVGHTGILKAAMKAATTVDECLSEIVPLAQENGYHIFIIADHGNADIMENPNGSVHTAHTTNPVPCFYIHKDNADKSLINGKLADIAPTILKVMGIKTPEEMTGDIILT